MATELENIKSEIESGESCVYTFENVDLDLMKKQGNEAIATKIEQCLALVAEICDAAGVE